MNQAIFQNAIEIQKVFIATILRTTNGGWICSIGKTNVFLPGSQLYNKLEDRESYIGKKIKVMIQKADLYSSVVSHKDYVKKLFERKEVLSKLQKGQHLTGTIKGKTEKGLYINVLDIIGFLYKDEMSDPDNYIINDKIDIIVKNIDIDKSILTLSSKSPTKKEEYSGKIYQKDTHLEIKQNYIKDIKVDDVLNGVVKKAVGSGYIIEFANGATALLRNKEIPKTFKLEEGSHVDVAVSEINHEKQLFFVSVVRMLDLKWQQVKEQLDSCVIPNETVLSAKVVYLEKDLVTLSIPLDDQIIYGYIKNEDLAWERVQNASEVVYLHEELSVRYLYTEKRRFYFDLKWQFVDLYPKELFKMDIEEMLSSMDIQENKFIAKVSILHEKEEKTSEQEISGAIISNIIAWGDSDKNVQLVDKFTGTNITAFVSYRYAYGLEDGKYYIFTLDIAPQEKREKEHRPYMFTAKLHKGALPVEDPFKQQVEKSFKENKTPKSNRESASYLKEIGADMYTDRDRMFYELLQNADDASSIRGVKVMVQIKENYLIFTHDGLSFSRQDFRSIVSTANSTKRLDRKKTGYKGIGFKSVFTDSDKVYIKTGGFFFVFNKSAEIFSNFREFYRYVNPIYTEDQLNEFFEENRENEEEFEGVDHLPWQLLPFWVEECPNSLRGTSFMRKCNVAIALEMDATADKYREIIKGIIQKPRFMLFLRNTLRIQFGEKKYELLSIAKQEDKATGVVKLKNSFDEKEEEVSYIVKEGSEIQVANENFVMCGIPMKKESKILGSREKWFMYQIVEDTEIPITSIPERIIAANTTTISYAFMLNENGQAVPIPDKTPSLYAYLPMEDRRYLFPFFINADFELSSNRQNAKQVSVWNEFLFYNIGKDIVSWIANLAKGSHPSYLKLLPKEFFTEELEEGKIDRLALQFNRGYKESLKDIAFIKNDKGNIVTQSEIVIDESGFANVIGADTFCHILNLNKRLVSQELEAEPLCNNLIFTEIEHIQSNDLTNQLFDSDYRLKFLRYWYKTDSTLKYAILDHIISLIKKRKNMVEYIKNIPAYTCGNRCFSFNKLLKSSKYLLRLKEMENIHPLLAKLGFFLVDGDESTHPFHKELSEDIEAYKLHVFQVVTNKTKVNTSALNALEKCILFQHFSNSKYGIKTEQLGNWRLFQNQDGLVTPLDELTHIDNTIYGGITTKYVIDELEYKTAPKLLGHYLMKEKNQYDEIVVKHWDDLVSKVGNSEQLALCLYQLASTTYLVAEHEQAEEKDVSQILTKAFVYAGDQMHEHSGAFISSNLSKNEPVKLIVEQLSGKYIPSEKVTGALFQKPFVCHEQHLGNLSLNNSIPLSNEQVKILLSYCQESNDTILTKHFFTKKEDSYFIETLPQGYVNSFTKDPKLRSFVEDHCNNIHLLPPEFSKYCNLKGVLSEEELLMFLINSLKSFDSILDELLPLYTDSVSSVKKAFVEKVSQIYFTEGILTNDNDKNLLLLRIASTIEKIDDELYETIRNKTYVVQSGKNTKLIDIKLQHTVEVDNVKYPLSKLLPNEDKLAQFVDKLKERIEDSVSKSFSDKLFGDKVDTNRTSSIFAEINKNDVVLSNGAQLAFVLEYARTNHILNNICCKVYDCSNTPIAQNVCKYWLIHGHSFIAQSNILNGNYEDVIRYLTIPYSVKNGSCSIKDNTVEYQYIKSSLNKTETFCLLDYLYANFNKGISVLPTDMSSIKQCLGITNDNYVVSSNYSLQEEKIPVVIEEWRQSAHTLERTDFVIKLFELFGEDSDVVLVRKYLDEKSSEPVTVTTTPTLSQLTCKWIVNKQLTITDTQYSILQDIIQPVDFKRVINFSKLETYVSEVKPYLTFGDYSLYLYLSEIPWNAVINTSNYTFHTYVEGNIAIKGDNIYVNEDCLFELKDLIKSIINTEGFTADDFVKFLDVYQSMLSGKLDGEIDDDIDEEARKAASELARQEAMNWLSARGYDITNATTDFSFIHGVKKGMICYHIVVKSFRSKNRELKINPNEWLELIKENARLMLYLGHMSFAVIDRQTLLSNHDFLRLRIAASNFSLDNNKLDYTISKLAENIQMFERTHFVFEHVNESILTRADSLDGYDLYKSNTNEEFSAGSEDDI